MTIRRAFRAATLWTWAGLTTLAAPALSAPIHVSTTGSDLDPGTQAQPVRTLAHAISLAAGGGDRVHIAEGLYAESVNLVSGVSLYGGFDPANAWTRDPALHPSVIAGGATAVIGDGVSAITLDGLVIRSMSVPAGSSMGAFLNNSQDVHFVTCRFEAGNGGPGVSGNAGMPGPFGGGGQPGTPGCENSAQLCGMCSRPIGGSGGVNAWATLGGKGGDAGLGPAAGDSGRAGMGAGGGIGGPGTPSRYTGSDVPYRGAPGAPGANGPHGSPGAAIGVLGASGYSPASGGAGQLGEHGSGGGGGGGGGGGTVNCDSYGSSGGGGGAGGARGGIGTGGSGAGGSFAIVLHLCGGVTVEGCEIHTGSGGGGGAGGAGGNGGNGGLGGAGGPYGGSSEQDDGANGVRGGDGGRGGNGGSGGGGGGGPTIGIFNSGPVAVGVQGNSFLLGTPGPGGAGPSPGFPGVAAQIQGPSGVVAVDDRFAAAGTLELAIAPNPFQGRSHIDYATPVAGHLTLTVYDLRGARVATLADGIVPAGRHSAVWEGGVEGGGRAPAGVYFVRLAWSAEGRSDQALRKVVLTR